MKTVWIKPVQQLNKTARRVDFSHAEVEYGVGAHATFNLLTEDGQVIAAGSVRTTPEQYRQWGTDDAFVLNAFVTNLGLEPGEPPVVEEPDEEPAP